MSRLNDLLTQLEASNPSLADDLRRETTVLSKRRPFGLNFERHIPELVRLPERRVRRGDKVVFRPAKGGSESVDARLWIVTGFEANGSARKAQLVLRADSEEPETATRAVEDLVVVAEFRDRIYPGLRPTGSVEQGGDRPAHVVINGENYHVLEALTFVHRGEVDCIYIDPPYNTRDKDWKYNNDYVDSDDAYRHSKWLAMMERRLRVAKDLLNPEESVLIVTIDEREYLRLGMLLEQMFPASRIQMVSTTIKRSGTARGKEFYRVDEYIFFVYIGAAVVTDALVEGLCITEAEAAEGDEGNDKKTPPVRWESLLRSGTGAQREESHLKFYPVLVDPERAVIEGAGDIVPLDKHPEDYKVPPGLVAVWPMRQDGSEGRWQLSRKTFETLLSDRHVKIGRINKKTGKVTIKYLPTGLRQKLRDGEVVVVGEDEYGGLQLEYAAAASVAGRPKTQWNAQSHSATDYGSSLLRRFLPGRRFPFPKSLYAVEDTLRFFVANKPDALILDFFAGSGTTTHAVMRLNRQDGGRRRSICVTNNEVSADEAMELRDGGFRPGDSEWENHGIFEHITKPRVQAALTGNTPLGDAVKGTYKFRDDFPMSEGFEENAAFFDLTYEDPERVRHGLAFPEIAPLLWMRAGNEGPIIDQAADEFSIASRYGVLFNVDSAAAFIDAVRGAEGMRMAFIITDDESQFQAIVGQLPHEIEAVRLYSAYLENFKIAPRG